MAANAIFRWAWTTLLIAGCAVAGIMVIWRPHSPDAGRAVSRPQMHDPLATGGPGQSAAQPAGEPKTPEEQAAILAARPRPRARSARRAAAATATQAAELAPPRPNAVAAPPSGNFAADLQPSPPNLDARIALSFVGLDPMAEAVWIAAINDPDLPADERNDLIEDLNEDGFPDPEHPTEDDLPLIESRLALIEELAPEAMDDVNADAFAEAYKDLLNMYDDLTSP